MSKSLLEGDVLEDIYSMVTSKPGDRHPDETCSPEFTEKTVVCLIKFSIIKEVTDSLGIECKELEDFAYFYPPTGEWQEWKDKMLEDAKWAIMKSYESLDSWKNNKRPREIEGDEAENLDSLKKKVRFDPEATKKIIYNALDCMNEPLLEK